MESVTLDSLLGRLRRLQQRGGLPVSGEGTHDWYEVMLFPAAQKREIESAQMLLGKQLPDDFLRFWQTTDGANLFVNESGLHGVGVASTRLIVELQQEEAELYGPITLAPYAVFARVNGSGDFLVFELGSGRVLDGIHAEQPGEWRPIAASFSDWLRRLLDANGRYYWLEALYRPAESEG